MDESELSVFGVGVWWLLDDPIGAKFLVCCGGQCWGYFWVVFAGFVLLIVRR